MVRSPEKGWAEATDEQDLWDTLRRGLLRHLCVPGRGNSMGEQGGITECSLL